MEASQIKRIAKKCDCFKTLDDEELDLLLFYGELKEFASGVTIYRTREVAEGTFCLILSGGIETISESGCAVGRMMGSGQVIGEIGAISPQQRRTLTARAVEPSSVLEWDVKYIKKRWPTLMEKLKEQAWKHLAQYYESEKK